MRLFEPQFRSAHEVQESLHDGIQPVDFAVEHGDSLTRQFLARRKALLQILQPKPHRIQRIFYFVCYPGSNPAERRQALGNLQLSADALDRLEIAQSDQRAHARASFGDHLYVHADPPRGQIGLRAGQLDLGRRHRRELIVTLQAEGRPHMVARRKDFVRVPAQELIGGHVEKILHRRADHHRAAIAREQQQAILEPPRT